MLSGLFHDEPTIEALNAAGLELSAVGNHELDEGWAELSRMQNGGCHPRDGCQDGMPFGGAAFRFLAANVVVDPARAAPAEAFPPYAVRQFDGVKVGFIGLTLRSAPDVVTPTGIAGLSFRDEARTANAVAAELRRQGVRTIVVLIHEGARAPRTSDICRPMSGAIPEIVRRFSPDIDVVVSGHTHRAYVCTLGRTLVTSADAFGRMITDIELRLDRRTGRVVSKSASNVLVTRDVSRDERVSAILTHYSASAATEARRVVGSIATEIVRSPNAAGESPLGDVVADGMLAASRERRNGGAAFALMNPGGIRTHLTRDAGPDEPAGGPVTYADLYRVLPFGNQLLVMTLTGDAVRRLLEQQFDNPTPGTDTVLQVSGNFTYTYVRSRPAGRRVDPRSMHLSGAPIDLSGRYRVVMPDFVWAGGDRFSVALEGTDVTPAIADLDALSSYVQSQSPISPGPADRIRREP